MLCCELESTVEDVASGLEKAAMEEVERKSIIGNAYILTRCANPYGIENLVIIEKQNRTAIYYCGKLVFLWNYGLKRYICGEWIDILEGQVQAIKSQRRQAKTESIVQSFANKYARQNYVVC
jgi:hypothetical protein